MKIAKEKFSEIIVSLIIMIVPLYCLFEINTLFVEKKINTGGAESNAALFPRLLSICLLILLVSHLIGTIIKKNTGDILVIKIAHKKRLLMVLLSLVIYIAMLPLLGYYITTPVFMFVCLRITGEKHLVKSIMISLLSSVLVGLFFSKIMNLILPSGTINIF